MAKKKAESIEEPDLAGLRQKIDSVDQKIQALINERAGFAQQVAVAKGADARSVDFFRPEREAESWRGLMAEIMRPA